MSLVSDERVEELLAIQKCYDALYARLKALIKEMRGADTPNTTVLLAVHEWADRLAVILEESE